MTYKADQLQPVSNMIRIPNIVSAHPSTGIKSIPDLIAYLKANPDKLTYGSSGVGQSPHLTGAWFLQLTGLKMVHVPFRGAGPALQAALAGDIQILFDNLYPSLPQVQDGKLNGALRHHAGAQRARRRTSRPCARARRSLSKFDVSSWFGVFLPKAAPAPRRRGAQQGDQGDAGARGYQEELASMGATRRLGHAAAIFRFRAGGDQEIRRASSSGRPADGGELTAVIP